MQFTKIILLHLPSATGKFLKIAQVKTRWTFIHSVDIRLRSSVVARSLSKREVPGSNPTVGKNFTFCNSRSTCDPHSSSKPMRMKSTMTYTVVPRPPLFVTEHLHVSQSLLNNKVQNDAQSFNFIFQVHRFLSRSNRDQFKRVSSKVTSLVVPK